MLKLTLLALVLAPSLAFAAQSNPRLDRIERETQACLDNDENGSTAGMNGCLIEGDEKADRLLNETYQRAVKSLKQDKDADSVERLKRLQAAQRAWIPSRTADCTLVGATMLGGSGESTMTLSCLYGKTVERVKFLDENAL